MKTRLDALKPAIAEGLPNAHLQAKARARSSTRKGSYDHLNPVCVNRHALTPFARAALPQTDHQPIPDPEPLLVHHGLLNHEAQLTQRPTGLRAWQGSAVLHLCNADSQRASPAAEARLECHYCSKGPHISVKCPVHNHFHTAPQHRNLCEVYEPVASRILKIRSEPAATVRPARKSCHGSSCDSNHPLEATERAHPNQATVPHDQMPQAASS
mmetsp:Transcript_116666/g.206532  ORF Transcript_116666/g.206532 Transcript_116666/m.206532 type:complete len:213 (-) Transcript_116666:807-1445(-)